MIEIVDRAWCHASISAPAMNEANWASQFGQWPSDLSTPDARVA